MAPFSDNFLQRDSWFFSHTSSHNSCCSYSQFFPLFFTNSLPFVQTPTLPLSPLLVTAGAGGHADTGSVAHIAQFAAWAGAVDSAVAKFAAIPAAGARITRLARGFRAELYRWLGEVLLRLISTGPLLFPRWFGVFRRLLLYPLSRRLNPCGLETGRGRYWSEVPVLTLLWRPLVCGGRAPSWRGWHLADFPRNYFAIKPNKFPHIRFS